MGSIDNNVSSKGRARLYYILVGMALMAGIIYILAYLHDRDSDIIINVPKVEVR
jgi:hypothetical protein